MKGLTPGQIAKACQGIYYGPEAIRDTEVTNLIRLPCLDGWSFLP